MSLKASLLKRRERFLSTAFPYFREKVKAIRLCSSPFLRVKSLAPEQVTLFLLWGNAFFSSPGSRLKTFRISSLPFNLSFRGNRKEDPVFTGPVSPNTASFRPRSSALAGPWPCGALIPAAPLWSSYAPGNQISGYV